MPEGSLAEFGITRKLTVNARAAGPRIGKEVQRVIVAAKKGFWEQDGDSVVVDGVQLLPAEFELELQSDDESNAITFLPGGGFVLLDTVTTPELEGEGLARDVIRAVQQARKQADLDVSDRIRLTLATDADGVIDQHRDLIAAETLASSIEVVQADNGETMVGSGSTVTVTVERA